MEKNKIELVHSQVYDKDLKYEYIRVTGDWRFRYSGTSGSRRVGYEEHQDTTILVSCAGIDEKIHKDIIQTCT